MHKRTIIKPVQMLLAYGASVQAISNSFPYVSKRRVKKIRKQLVHMKWLAGQSCHYMVGNQANTVLTDGIVNDFKCTPANPSDLKIPSIRKMGLSPIMTSAYGKNK